MGTCTNHPDRETNYMCSKHGIYLCEDCLECRDPDIYCKFRSACPIWYEYKEKKREARRKAELEAVDTSDSIGQPEEEAVRVG